MAYYFTVEQKKGDYLPLNIKLSKFFQVNPKYKKDKAYTLQEIDLFTMMFNDEEELRKALLLERIIPSNLSTKSLSTRTLIKGTYNKVPYDFLYQKDIEYIMNPSKVIEIIMRRYYQNDFVFIKKFADYFSNHHGCTSTAPEIRQLAEISIREGKRNYHFEEIDKNGDHQVARLVKLLILKHYEMPNGYIDYKNEVNYRNLHDVIAFINNYDKKLTNQTKDDEKYESKESSKTVSIEFTEPNISTDEEPIFTTIDKQAPKITVKTKTKKKINKNYHLEGQIDFTNLI